MNLPAEFIERIKLVLRDEWSPFQAALSADVPVSIRLNKRKVTGFLPFDGMPVPWATNAYYLPQRPSFTFDPLFHAGCYYVQEASSMFVSQVFAQYVAGDVNVLDLCAAPGGKSTLIADAISENSVLVSNETIRSRAYILAENMAKWGTPNVIVTNNDPARIGELRHLFDVVLVDAPCSGEGMFRKGEVAVSEWSVANVRLCKERQQRIVADVWESLKPGGILIYSTCTYNAEENEDNARWIAEELGADFLPIELTEEWGVSGAKKGKEPCYRFFPHKTKGEGFFLAALRKQEGVTQSTKWKQGKDKSGSMLPNAIKTCIRSSENYNFISKENDWYAVPKSIAEVAGLMNHKLAVLSMGIHLGEMKGTDFIPSQPLAVSNELYREVFSIAAVDWRTAIAYLKREPVVLANQPKGVVLLTYRDVPLGFVKNVGNRANNLYPQEWRIRSNNVPSDRVDVV